MRVLSFIALLSLLAILASGCAHYQTVKVLVIDDKTKVPVPGATVITCYDPSPFSLASRRQATGKTGKDGAVFLQANYLEREPTLFGKPDFSFAPSFAVEAPGYADTVDFSLAIFNAEKAYTSREPEITISIDAGSSNGRPSDAFKDLSHAQQWGRNLKTVWLWFTSPFRPTRLALYE